MGSILIISNKGINFDAWFISRKGSLSIICQYKERDQFGAKVNIIYCWDKYQVKGQFNSVQYLSIDHYEKNGQCWAEVSINRKVDFT